MGRAAAAAASRRAKKMRDLAGNLFETILRGELEHIEEYKSADLSPHLPLLSRLVFVQEQCQVFQKSITPTAFDVAFYGILPGRDLRFDTWSYFARLFWSRSLYGVCCT